MDALCSRHLSFHGLTAHGGFGAVPLSLWSLPSSSMAELTAHLELLEVSYIIALCR